MLLFCRCFLLYALFSIADPVGRRTTSNRRPRPSPDHFAWHKVTQSPDDRRPAICASAASGVHTISAGYDGFTSSAVWSQCDRGQSVIVGNALFTVVCLLYVRGSRLAGRTAQNWSPNRGRVVVDKMLSPAAGHTALLSSLLHTTKRIMFEQRPTIFCAYCIPIWIGPA